MSGGRRLALVTGGTRGIGRAVTMKLAASGIDVAAAFVNDCVAAQQVADGCQGAGTTVTVHRADVGDQDSCQRLIGEVLEAHGRLDYLVNNAGTVIEQRYGDISAQDWRWPPRLPLAAQLPRSLRFLWSPAALLPHLHPPPNPA